MKQINLTVDAAKKQAKLLRAKLNEDGQSISHSKSLELIAQQHGFRDWNSMHAALGNGGPRNWNIGDRVSGKYLSQPFSAEIIAIKLVRDGWYRLTFEFDEPVDVVTFEGFSNHRKRTSQVIGPDGVTKEKTSDGKPHMTVEHSQ